MALNAKAVRFYGDHYAKLAGKTVEGVVFDNSDESIDAVFGLKFTDGTVAWIMRDPEGSGPGFLDIERGN